MKRWWIPAVAAGLLILVCVGVFVPSGRGGGEPVVTCGGFTLDNTGLAYYYWSEYFYFAEAYGGYLDGTLDFSQPLDQQAYSQTQTWQDYLLEQTLATVRDTMSMVFRAGEEGFALPEDYAGTMEQVLVNFEQAALSGGYGSVEEYLQASYGAGASLESFREYLYNAHLAAAYSDHLLARIQPTDQEARAHFRLYEAEYVENYAVDPDDEGQWLELARKDLQVETYQNQFLTICSSYTFLVDYEGIVLTPPEGLYE